MESACQHCECNCLESRAIKAFSARFRDIKTLAVLQAEQPFSSVELCSVFWYIGLIEALNLNKSAEPGQTSGLNWIPTKISKNDIRLINPR